MSKLATKYKFKGLEYLAVTNTNRFVLLPRVIGKRSFKLKYISSSAHMGVKKIYYDGNRYDENHLKELRYLHEEEIEKVKEVIFVFDRLSSILDD